MDLFGDAPPEDIEEEFEPAEIEESSEPQGLAHPRNVHFSVGHEDIETQFLELFNSGHLPHGMIFYGPKGIGKATMAYRLARFLFKQGTSDPNQNSLFGAPELPKTLDVAADDPVSRRVSSGGHSDFMNVERALDPAKNKLKDAVSADDIRKIPGFLRMTAADGGWRVVIIDDADTMTWQAQNSVLKILEEPPKNTLIILIAHRLGALLPTIRSRAHAIAFHPLESDTLKSLLAKQGYHYSLEEMDALTHLAEGSAGRAVQLIEEKGIDTLNSILEIFKDYPQWNWVQLHGIAGNLGQAGQEQSYLAFQQLLSWIFGRLAKSKARGQGVEGQILDLDVFHGFLRNSSLEELLKICENLESHFNKVNVSSLDKKQAVLSAFSLIAA